MRRVFRDFLDKVQAAGPDAIALVYYTGYAVPFEGENYLIPADARLARDSDIPIEAVRLFDLMRPLADAPALAKIVILDAARPLPFRIQGGRLARGLSAIKSAPGMLVAFSAAPGEIAEDGPGPYGAYATAIAEMVREPGLDLDTMFARIRVRTHEATNGQQTPWEVSQLNQVVMLVPGAPSAPPSQALSAPQTAVGAPRVRRAAASDDRDRRGGSLHLRDRAGRSADLCGIRPRLSEQSLRATHLGADPGTARGARMAARAPVQLAGSLLDLSAALSRRNVCL